MILHYQLHEVEPYINWAYFFHAWGTKDRMMPELIDDAHQVLKEMDGTIQTHAIVELFAANGNGEDIVLIENERLRLKEGDVCQHLPFILPMLRQQHGEQCLCWADFLKPSDLGQDTIGLFATSVDRQMVDDKQGDEYRYMLCQTLADRLAEATAERMHEEVRKRLWGYAADEQISVEEMFQEKYIGRRPAVGYPSLPDQSLNFLINGLIDMSRIGITLTESGAMLPHASTTGLLFAHPQARHFSIGKIGEDQLQDYAKRRKMPLETMRKFLVANL